MEKSPVYTEVAIKRWEKLTGLKRVKLDGQEKGANQGLADKATV